MRNIIYKYEFGSWLGSRSINMPKDAALLKIGIQGDWVYGWFMVDTDKPEECRHFEIIGTGQEVLDMDRKKHLGTVITDSSLVWHVFEVTK